MTISQPYPLDRASRRELRKRIEREALAEAAATVRLTGRSPKCRGELSPAPGTVAGPLHAPAEGGCSNSGETCLCPCHDDTAGGGDAELAG